MNRVIAIITASEAELLEVGFTDLKPNQTLIVKSEGTFFSLVQKGDKKFRIISKFIKIVQDNQLAVEPLPTFYQAFPQFQ